MSTTDTPPVTLDRITTAVEAVGLIPFTSATGQIAAILPNRTVRIAAPEGRPAQGVADYPRFFHADHADQIASAVRRLNDLDLYEYEREQSESYSYGKR